MTAPIEYVAGLMFSTDRAHVALIRKNKPEWQHGRLNAIGGKVEPGEDALTAMVREFEEETGVLSDGSDWNHVCTLAGPWGCVTFFAAFTDSVWFVRTVEQEEVYVGAVAGFLADATLIPNLKVVIPLALDTSGIVKPVALNDAVAAPTKAAA